MHEYKRRRISSRGAYADLSVSFIALLVGGDRTEVSRRLVEFYSQPEYADRKRDPIALGDFIVAYKTAREAARLLNQ
ncbi:MAG: hypothetical protein EKK48_29865 [Candidatus Melainabacteria bacterium]|nr:MAG: hypothetical protein EKK48_29865 [Candidatus Melainabacteria bacterium]